MKMKKILSVILAIAMCAVALVSCSKDDTPDGMKLASTEAASYQLYVPEDWEVGLTEVYTTANAKDAVLPNVSATTYEFDDPTATIELWWETSKDELTLGFGEIVMISESDTVLDGRNAKQYVYSAKMGDVEYTFHQVAAITSSGVVYLLTFTSSPDSYEENLETFNQITSEFRF